MRIDIEKVKEQIRKEEIKGKLFPLDESDSSETLASLTSLVFEFKDNEVSYDYSTDTQSVEGVSDPNGTYIRSLSPLFYDKVMDDPDNITLMGMITSLVPYYYMSPSTIGDIDDVEVLTDTRDCGLNDVPTPLQTNPFYNTWFRNAWGYVQNSMLLDVHNKMKYPFINENQYLNSALFPEMSKTLLSESKVDSKSYVDFMDTEEENDSVYKQDYEFLGEEEGCLDYMDRVVTDRLTATYSLLDYTDKQSLLLSKWGESLYESGQLGREQLDTSKTVFRLQDIRNELMRRKFAGSRTLYDLTISSIDRQGTVLSAMKAYTIPSVVRKGDIYHPKRVVRVLRIPGILSEFHKYDSEICTDILDTYGDVSLDTIVPLFYTSATLDISKDKSFNNEMFYSGSSGDPSDRTKSYSTIEDVAKYRNFLLRDNSNVINWNNLQSILVGSSVKKDNFSLDTMHTVGTETKYWALDNDYSDDDKVRLDIVNETIDLSKISCAVADIGADKVLYHSNSMQSDAPNAYPYVTSSIANGNSISLMDTYWLDYVENEARSKSKVQDNTEIGVQLNTIVPLDGIKDNTTTPYGFFGLSYTDKTYDDSTDTPTGEPFDSTKSYRYALLWYCSLNYDYKFNVKGTPTKTLVSKVALKPKFDDSSKIQVPYKSPSGDEWNVYYKRLNSIFRKSSDGAVKDDYAKYCNYNIGVTPLLYSSVCDSDLSKKIWSADIGFFPGIHSFDGTKTYYTIISNIGIVVGPNLIAGPDTIVGDGDAYIVCALRPSETEGKYIVYDFESGTEKEVDELPTPDISRTYYTKFSYGSVKGIEPVYEFVDDTDRLGYSESMFRFSRFDITKDTDVSIMTDASMGVTSLNPDKDVKSIYYIINKPTTSGDDNFCWSSPISVVPMSDTLVTGLKGSTLEPDWYGLNCMINPYLNFTSESASPLRRKSIVGSYKILDLTEAKRKEKWGSYTDVIGASEYASLGNITMMRNLGFTCNNTGATPTSETYYGFYLKRTKPDFGDIVSTALPNSYEDACIKGDNRTRDAFDFGYGYVKKEVNKAEPTKPESGYEEAEKTLFILSWTQKSPTQEWPDHYVGTSKYFLWKGLTSEGKFTETLALKESRSVIYHDSLTGMKGIHISPNKPETSSATDKWYRNYFTIEPCKDVPATGFDWSKWYWNQSSNGKTICMDISVDYESLYDGSGQKRSLLLKDGSIELSLDTNTSNGTWSFVFKNGTNKVSSSPLEETDFVLPVNNGTEIVGHRCVMNHRISASILETSASSYTMILCVDNNVPVTKDVTSAFSHSSNKGISLFCEYKEDDTGGIGWHKNLEDTKWWIQSDCFYGTIYDVRLYNRGKSKSELYLLNQGMIREMYSYSPDVYKVASSMYNDLAFVRRTYVGPDEDADIVDVNAIRVFNRSVWDSIMVDPYPVSKEEKDSSSPQYAPDYSDPKSDEDIYVKVGNAYYFNDCVEQDLLDDAEVFNFKGNNPLVTETNGNVIIRYFNKKISVDPNCSMTLVNSLIEPEWYDHELLKVPESESRKFALKSDTSGKYLEQDISSGGYIKIPRKSGTTDDVFSYSTDIDFNFTMKPDLSVARWLSRGNNVELEYNGKMSASVARLSDTSVFDSSRNNVLMPLVIPSTELTGNSSNTISYMDKFYLRNVVLNNNFVSFLSTSSYYNEILTPVAYQEAKTDYNTIDYYVYTVTTDEYPADGKSYFSIPKKCDIGSTSSTYTVVYSGEDVYVEESGSRKKYTGDTLERGVTYYLSATSSEGERTICFDKSKPYFKILSEKNGICEVGLYNDRLVNRKGKYCTPSSITPYSRISFDTTNTTTYYYISDKYTDFYSYDGTKTIQYNGGTKEEPQWHDFTGSYFKSNVEYRYSDESKNWTFDPANEYYRAETNEATGKTTYSYTPPANEYNIEYTFVKKVMDCKVGSTEAPLSCHMEAETSIRNGVDYYTQQTSEGSVYYVKHATDTTGNTFSLSDRNYLEDRLITDTYYVKSAEGNYTLVEKTEGYKEVHTFTELYAESSITDKTLYTKETSYVSKYYNKWDAVRVLKEGTYYFTCKYPMQVIPFGDDVIDSSSNLNYTTYYASCRFKVVVKGNEKVLDDSKYTITGYPEKYHESNLMSTIKSSDHRMMVDENNRDYPHREMDIDLYVMDTSKLSSEGSTGASGLMRATFDSPTGSYYVYGKYNGASEFPETGITGYAYLDIGGNKWYTWNSNSSEYQPAGALIGMTEDYGFQWNLVGSNRQVNDADVVLLDRDTIESGVVLTSNIPVFLEKNYTSSFFIAKSVRGGAANSKSADDDLVDPIKIQMDRKKLSEEKVVSNKENDMDNQVLIAGRSYKVVFDYTACVSEMSYIDEYYSGTSVTDDEKVNYSRLVNMRAGRSLNDTEALNVSEYCYTSDGRSFVGDSNTNAKRSGFDITGTGTSTDPYKWEEIGGETSSEYYFGNPYSKSRDANYILRQRDTSKDTDSSIYRMNSRQNINGSYTFPYMSHVSGTIESPAYPESIGVVTAYGGAFKTMDYDRASLMKSHYDSVRNAVEASLLGLVSGSAAGLFSGLSDITPHFVKSSGGQEPATTLFIGSGDHDLYGYHASSRYLPLKNENIIISRTNLYSNNLLSNNAFDNKYDWVVSATSPNTVKYEWVPDDTKGKDVFQMSYTHKASSTTEGSVVLDYCTGDMLLTSRFETALSMKSNSSSAPTVKVVFVDGDGNKTPVTLNPETAYASNSWIVYSAETSGEITAKKMFFEITMTGTQTLSISKAVVRKCNTSSHYLGMSNAVNELTSTYGTGSKSQLALLGHNMVTLYDGEEYTPIQFNNSTISTVSADGKKVFRPKSGLYRVGEFISRYSLDKAANSRVVELIKPWVRKMIYSGAIEPVAIHGYNVVTNDVGVKVGKESPLGTTDVINVSGMATSDIVEVNTSDNDHYRLRIKKLPLEVNSANELKAYGMNMSVVAGLDPSAASLSDEQFSILFNCFKPNMYRNGLSYPVAMTNVQFINKATSNDSKGIVYELEYLPVVYRETDNHIAFNVLFYDRSKSTQTN